MIDVGEMEAARQVLGDASTPMLRAISRFLWPAAALGEAGPLSLLALELIADELDERDLIAA